MRKILIGLVLTFGVGGCASSSVNDRLDALEAQVAEVRRMASDAASTARDAQNLAPRGNTAAAEARRLAQQALDEARAANARAERISSECCSRK